MADAATPSKGAWTEGEKYQLLVQIISQLTGGGAKIQLEKLNMPGRTPKSLSHMVSKIKAEAKNYESGQGGGGSVPPGTPKSTSKRGVAGGGGGGGAKGRKKTTTTKTSTNDDNDDNDDNAIDHKPVKKKDPDRNDKYDDDDNNDEDPFTDPSPSKKQKTEV